MIYLDSCAVVKLIVPESESASLAAWLNQRSTASLITSKLTEVEVPRALRRSNPSVLGAVAGVLRRLYRVEINEVVRATAAAYLEPSLRSLDAIHLATADALVSSGQKLDAFVTYDKRLAAAATDAGMVVAIPGVS